MVRQLLADDSFRKFLKSTVEKFRRFIPFFKIDAMFFTLQIS